MSNKVLQDPSHVAQLRKYGHDLSKVRKFSSSVGQLLPVYYDLASPGDKYKLSTEMFTQVTDIVSPAMMHVKEHLDWFFVPLNQIFHFSKDALFAIKDYQTNLVTGSINTSTNSVIPMFDAHGAFASNMVTLQANYSYISDIANTQTVDDLFGLDEFGYPVVYNLQRMLELLGFSSKMWLGYDSILDDSNTIYINPMLACAYQKIFFDCYRNTDYTENDASYYNLDSYYTGTIATSDYNNVAKFFKLRYRPFGRDFFTMVKPAPLTDYGDTNMQGSFSQTSNSLAQFNNWLSLGSAQNSNGDQYSGSSFSKDLSISGRNTSNSSYQVNTAQLRGMFAVEKLMEITRRAAKRYDSQVLAHFGVNVPNGIDNHVVRIGSESSVLEVNQVLATSDSTNGSSTSTLGQKGGYAAGYSKAGKGLTFTAPCHGIIMGIYSAVPELDYNCNGLDRINQYRTRYDFYQPELDKLGMQPLFGYQSTFSYNTTGNSTVNGWQYRYQELKCKFNDICGAFNVTPYNTWTVCRDSFPSWVNFDASMFYCPPTMLDDVLLLHFEPTSDDSISLANCFGRDPLLHWFKFNVFKSSVMTNYSLPNL